MADPGAGAMVAVGGVGHSPIPTAVTAVTAVTTSNTALADGPAAPSKGDCRDVVVGHGRCATSRLSRFSPGTEQAAAEARGERLVFLSRQSNEQWPRPFLCVQYASSAVLAPAAASLPH
jgi:hypothetical protein